MTKPFREGNLWKGTIAKANYPKPVPKPPMILPIINSLTGTVTDQGFKPEDLSESYSKYSQKYWSGVEERKQEYRLRYSTGYY